MQTKRWIALFLTGVLICGMTGCGSEADEKPENGLRKVNMAKEESVVKEEGAVKEESAATQEDSKKEQKEAPKEEQKEETSRTEETPVEEEFEYEGDAASHYVELYAPIIGNYYFAMKEEWGAEKLLQDEMSLLCMDYYGEDGLDQVSYGFMDLDGDGYWELVIGSEELIFDAYTYKDELITQIFCGDARNRYYISEDEAAGYLIANEASAGALNSAWIYSQYDGTMLQTIQSILYDAEADSQNPWFMGADEDWDASNDSPVDEKLANDIIESYSNNYVVPEYLSLRYYL